MSRHDDAFSASSTTNSYEECSTSRQASCEPSTSDDTLNRDTFLTNGFLKRVRPAL